MTDCEFVDEQLKVLELPTTEEMEPDPAKREDLCTQLAEQLRKIAEAAPELDEGGQKVRVWDRHIPLSRSTAEFIQLGGELAFAGAKHDPITAGKAILGFFVKMYNKITKLTETQRTVYISIGEAIKNKKDLGRTLTEEGVSTEELEAYLNRVDLEIPTLSEDLNEMTAKGVLNATKYDGRGPYYELVF